MKRTVILAAVVALACGTALAAKAPIYDAERRNPRTVLSREFDIGSPYPSLMDSDGDGITDLVEYYIGTDPDLRDSNGNGVNDGMEILGLLR